MIPLNAAGKLNRHRIGHSEKHPTIENGTLKRADSWRSAKWFKSQFINILAASAQTAPRNPPQYAPAINSGKEASPAQRFTFAIDLSQQGPQFEPRSLNSKVR